MKLTNRKIKELISEERHASRMYKGYGLYNIARDESKHTKQLRKMLLR